MPAEGGSSSAHPKRTAAEVELDLEMHQCFLRSFDAKALAEKNE
mgnify:CR=1 FL=1